MEQVRMYSNFCDFSNLAALHPKGGAPWLKPFRWNLNPEACRH
jgi:hypothetical protein